jgi:hypothetical protein
MSKLLFFALFLGCLFSSPGRADEAPDPCAAESQRYNDSLKSFTLAGLPEASQALSECRKQASEQKALAYEQEKKKWPETGATWAAGLNNLPDGGWTLLFVPADGTYAVFGSRRHATRRGSVATVWLRYEYREAQTSLGASYKSAVNRSLFDCDRIAAKAVSGTTYTNNNLDDPGPSITYEEAKVGWTPVIPGTLNEFLLDWACRTTAGAQSAKKQ